VDGGDGSATVLVSAEEEELLNRMALRTMSDPAAEPVTGAELGARSSLQRDGAAPSSAT
jgi:Mn-containing catalase